MKNNRRDERVYPSGHKAAIGTSPMRALSSAKVLDYSDSGISLQVPPEHPASFGDAIRVTDRGMFVYRHARVVRVTDEQAGEGRMKTLGCRWIMRADRCAMRNRSVEPGRSVRRLSAHGRSRVHA